MATIAGNDGGQRVTEQSDHQRVHESRSNAWYTPPVYLDAVRGVLGTIDLDPASDAVGNRTVQATTYYSGAHDGLVLPWHGSVFCNPPYGKRNGKSNQELWTQKAIAEYQAGRVYEMILLVNAVVGERWFQPALDPYPICLVCGRIAFLDACGNRPRNDEGHLRGPTHNNCFIYFGAGPARFVEVFGRLGRCISPWPGHDRR
jgi:hypothetical protein